MRQRRISLKYVMFIMLVVFSIIPDVGIKFSTAGLTWTAYRIVIVLSLAFLVFGHGRISISREEPMTRWILFMTVWSLYGIILLFVGSYTDYHNGFVEWFSIVCGLVVFCCMSRYLSSEQYVDALVTALYWLLNVLVLVGFIEIITGWHWTASAFKDYQSTINMYDNNHLATGFMYNMNDFSALLTCLSPILVTERLGKKRAVTLVGIVIINHINDATTCNIAILFFILYYFLILRGECNKNAIAFKALFWTAIVLIIVIALCFNMDFSERNDLLGAIARQITNARHGNGSLYRRIVLYKDALSAWFSTGMMGFGPAGFATYFTTHPSLSKLVNPHSLVLEILTQYGIVICGWFLWLLLWMFRSAKKLYKTAIGADKQRVLMVVAFIIVYFFASFAPSSFIGYSYQWVLIALMCSQLLILKKQEDCRHA